MIKDKEIIQALLTEKMTPNTVVKYLFLIIKLKQHHGSLLHDRKFHALLSKIDTKLASIVMVLDKTDRLSIKAIKKMIFVIEKLPEYTTELEVVSSQKEWAEVLAYLEQNIPNSTVTQKTTDAVELKVAWNGWHYKKSFDQDVEKLLA